MAATSGAATPIYPYKVLIGGTAQAVMLRRLEKATQTFLQGTPVQVEVASGFIIACAAITSVATALIAGFSGEPGANLTTSGVAKTLTQSGNPVNQPNAVFIPVGAWPNDGTTGFHEAIDSTIFIGVEGGSTTDADGTIAQTDLGALFGLTKDAGNNFWYVDKDKTTAATGGCVVITDLIDPVGTLHGRVGFKVLHAAQQLSGN
jgi:hypothetical protein